LLRTNKQQTETNDKDVLRLTPELPLEHGEKRLCANCGENKVYLDVRTLDWCEPCIAQLVEGKKLIG
jgi:hypothetical protein